MDGRRFDALARVLAAPSNRRRLLGIWLGGTTVAVAAATRLRGDAATQAPVCMEEGESCTLWVECCDGLFCDASRENPNDGVCRTGQAPAAAPNQQPPAKAPKSNLPKTNTKGDRGAPPSTPRPNDTDTRKSKQPKVDKRKIKDTADCQPSTDTLTIKNDNPVAVTITSIAVGTTTFNAEQIGKVLAGGTLGANETFVFRFGETTEPNKLSNHPLAKPGETAKIKIRTSAGTLSDSCKEPKAP